MTMQTAFGKDAGDWSPLYAEFPQTEVACADNLAFMAKFPDGSFRLIATSPPYNQGKAYENRTSLDDYRDGQAAVIAECVRLLDERGSLCWQVGNHVENGAVVPLDMLLYPLFADHGLQLRNRIVWTFGHGLHCRRRLSGRHETILWWTRSDAYVWNLDPIRVPAKYPGKRRFKGPRRGELSGHPLGKNPGDVWDIPNVGHNHPEKTDHPCQYPVELAERLVLAMTRPGDAVLDPYMGSGSTLIAAARHGRRGFGCDIVPDYVDIARMRLDLLRRRTLEDASDGTTHTRARGQVRGGHANGGPVHGGLIGAGSMAGAGL